MATTKRSKTVRPAVAFREQLRATRKRLDYTQADLAAQLKAIGAPMDRATIAKIEGGSRQVTLEEALALAAALGVCPLHLFVSRDDETLVEVTPHFTVDAIRARAWVRGEDALGTSARIFYSEVPDSEWVRTATRMRWEEKAEAAGIKVTHVEKKGEDE